MYATYFVPSENVAGLVGKLETLQRRALKLGVAAIVFAVVKTVFRPHLDRERKRVGEMVAFKAITIQGDAPAVAGWVFVGTIDHEVGTEGQPINMVRTHSEIEIPIEFRTSTSERCDHCCTQRNRHHTFIVRNVETGVFAQIGRTCLGAFLGGVDPARVADYATHLLDLSSVVATASDSESVEYKAYDLKRFLVVTGWAIDADGWTSRGKAWDLADKGINVAATADLVISWFTSTSEQRVTRFASWGQLADATEAEAALAWLAKQDAADLYIHNCQTIAELQVVTQRTAGFAASILSAYRRACENALGPRSLTPTGTKHVGTLGKRAEFRLTLLGRIPIEGYYGTTYLHRFMDDAGNLVAWFATNPEVAGDAVGHDDGVLIDGASYVVKATPKSHDDYKGQAQTRITRLAVQPLTKPRKKKRSGSQSTYLSELDASA